MIISLLNKTAVVCGASKGIGLAVANELAQLGATCILLARSADRLKEAAAGLAVTGNQQHSFYAIDFTDAGAVKQVIERIVSLQPVHILINNTGGPPAGPIIDAKPDAFVAAFQQHLVTSHTLTTAVIEGMKAEGYGRVINIISTSVKIPLRNLGVSNTIRGAMASWAKTMANELGGYGITVNNILPGYTKTSRLNELLAQMAARANKSVDEVAAGIITDIPAGRFGDAAELAAVAAFLATPAAAYVNGTSIPVDGGRTGSI